MWWIASNDTNTFTIDDQFLIGDNVIGKFNIAIRFNENK